MNTSSLFSEIPNRRARDRTQDRHNGIAGANANAGDYSADGILSGTAATIAPTPPMAPRTRPREQGSFEIRNTGAKIARGIEIEIIGFGDDDTFHAYYLTRPGSPKVIRDGDSIRIRFESSTRLTAHALSQSTFVRISGMDKKVQPFIWELAMFSAGGCDRFHLELSTQKVAAAYRWLVAKDEFSDELVTDDWLAHVQG